MAARAIFKGAIQFDGVNLPVKLYTAVREQRISFNLLHDQDNARLQQQMVCSVDNKPVEKEHQVKGYEVEGGRYVEFAPEELDALEPETTRNIRALDFVDESAVDPRFFDRCYYLGPDGLEKQYAAVAKALEKAGKIAICQWTMRKHGYLGALRSKDGLLEMVIMRFAADVIDTASLSVPEEKISQKEMQMAEYLIDMLKGDFHPGQYHDEFQQQLRKLIEQKAQGRPIEIKKPKPRRPTKAPDLLATLEKSVEHAKSKKEKAHAAK
jgi:DNA end-binding protein Ku